MITIYVPGLSQTSYEYRRGDAQLIYDDKMNAIVIDGGENALSSKLIAYCRAHKITHVTYVLTHWHCDHDAGMKAFLDVSGIFVDHIYCPPPSELKGLQESGVGDDYARALKRIAQANSLKKPITYPAAGVRTEIKVGDIRCQLWRRKANRGDYNNYEINNTSVCAYFPDLYYLTTGDTINAFDIYLNTFKDPVSVFKVPHHGNACTSSPCEKLKKYGAKLCWYNDMEPRGTAIGGTGFSKYGAGYCKRYFTTLRTDEDIVMVAKNKQLTVTKGSTKWTFQVPYCTSGRWVEMDQGWKYIKEDGTELKDGAYEIDGKWYYFDDYAYRIEGWVTDPGDGIDRYCKPYMLISQLLDIGSERYYLDGYGRKVTGWQEIEGKWYCFDEGGRMRFGWYEDPELGKRYLEPEKGYMYVNTTARIDGIDYSFDGYGRVTELSDIPVIIPNEGFKGYNVSKRTTKIEYIVIHYTGAEGTAAENVVYFNKADRRASADFFVGHAGEICEYNPNIDGQYSWHCGGGRQGSQGGTFYGKCKNANSIGIEMCVKKSGSSWILAETTFLAAAKLVSWLMEKYDVPNYHVIRHYDVTGKLCPNVKGWISPDDEWKRFLTQIGIAPETPQLYRVRKSWTDAKSQKGAFLSFENAQRCAEENPGYHVYDINGTEII